MNGIKCYRKGGCGPYEMCSCNNCPASKPEYASRYSSATSQSSKLTPLPKVSEIKYVDGDILTSPSEDNAGSVIICHQVNCKGVMGAGLAKQIRTRFPEVYYHYKESCDSGGSSRLGEVQLVSCLAGAGYLVANIFGQDGYGRDKCYTDYEALRRAFRWLSSMTGWTIRIPYNFGCGLGGGDWATVLNIIQTELADKGCKVEIWKL